MLKRASRAINLQANLFAQCEPRRETMILVFERFVRQLILFFLNH
jgi:hypothetical protein